MSDNPAVVLFDVNGNPMAVSGGMSLPTGTIGLMMAAVDSNGFVRFVSTISGSLQVTGSVVAQVTFPQIQQVWTEGTQGISGAVALTNWPAVVGVTASAPVQVWSEGPLGVSGTVTVSNLPVNQQVWTEGPVGVSGSVAISSGTVTVGAWGTNVTASIFLQGATQLNIDNFPLVQAISGNVGAVIENWPATIGVSASAALPVINQGTVGVSGSVTVGGWGTNVTASVVLQGPSELSVNNFPATQNVSGTVFVTQTGSFHVTVDNNELSVSNFPAVQAVSGTVTAEVGNWPLTMNVSASAGIRTYDGGTQGVSGSVNTYTSGLQGVSGTVQVWSEGPLPVSGAVALTNWPAVVGVSGSVGVTNFPAVQQVSGSQLTGSTFSGFPVVVGGAWNSGSQVGNAQYVKAIAVDPSGSVYITSSGSLPVHVDSQVSVDNFPATQNVSGTVNIGNWPAIHDVTGSVNTYTSGLQGVSGTVQVWSEGPLPVSGTVFVTQTGSLHVTVDNSELSIANFPAIQNVSGAVALVNWPATMGVSASATLPSALTNWPAVHGVSGSQLTGSTFGGFPVVMGGVWLSGSAQFVKAIATDISGAQYITSSGSLPVTVSNLLVISGVLEVQGTQASGSTQVGNPVFVGGVDSTGIFRAVLTDAQGRIITAPAASSTTYGEAFGDIALRATSVNLIVRTPYTEQASNAQRSVVSTSTSDVNSTGTGAWKVTITYYDQSYNGPFTETVTLNGTTAVNTVGTNICFIEKIVVSAVGSGGVTVGTINLQSTTAGGGTTIWSIQAGDNQTFGAHHYTAPGKTTYITAMGFSINGGGGSFFIKSKVSGSNAPEIQITEMGRQSSQAATTERSYVNIAIPVAGPARINMYVLPDATTALTYHGSFDFYDQ